MISRDGSFISNVNGTVLNNRTGLMWASNDNGKDITWYDAKRYCENYRGGGYSDWRMPTLDELEGLYANYGNLLTNLIHLTGYCPWSSERKEGSAGFFHFAGGYRFWVPPSNAVNGRALPVRASRCVEKDD